MKGLSLLLTVVCLGGIISCSDDDKRDDTILDMSKVVGKNWYCTNWANNKDGYTTDDLLEIIKFGEDGRLWTMEFSGKLDQEVGTWSSDKNEITLNYYHSTDETWNVLHSGDDYLNVKVNKGERNFGTVPRYLQDLTADAFLQKEVSKTGGGSVRVGVEIAGRNTVNIKDVTVIMDEGKVIPLTFRSNTKTWNAGTDIEANEYDLPGTDHNVLFYVNAGGVPVKFADKIYSNTIPEQTYDEFNLNAINRDRTLDVSWNAFPQTGIYYRVEVFDGNMDLSNPYFVSKLYAGIGSLSVTKNTQTENDIPNRLDQLKDKMTYVVRLSAIVLEPGVDYDHNYSYTNLQSVTYVKRSFVWED